MKKYLTILIAASALVLSACASAPEPRSPTVVDQDYVGTVEAHARQAGVDVVWINPPRKDRNTEEPR